MGDKSDAFLFYKVKFVHLFNKQFAETYQFKEFLYNTIEIIHFTYAHFKEIEIVSSLTSRIIVSTNKFFSIILL